MKLDATDLRYITRQEFRVLTAVEMGSKNHEVVPSSLAAQISGLYHSGIGKLLGSLAKRNLIARVQNASYDGYRLTYGGYDFLALRAFSKRDTISAVGRRIGVGKESDIYIVSSPEQQQQQVLKIHRLGRISFRAIKEKRDYMGNRKSASWMYMSRLAAAKEYAFMQILYSHGFPVPKPIDQARHCIVMSLIDAYPLRQIAVLPPRQIPLLYSALMKLIVRLAKSGLIHGDFNEFNLLIREIRQNDSDDDDDDPLDSTSNPPSEKGPRGRAANPLMKQYALQADQPSNHHSLSSQGLKVEQGNGYERIVADPSVPASSHSDSEQEEEEEQGDDQEQQEEEDDDLEENEQIYLEDGVAVEPILIDFPQMVSTNHENAEYYFDRDVQCVRRFFRKRFRYISDEFPRFQDVVPSRFAKVSTSNATDQDNQKGESEVVRLDILAKASGYGGTSKQDRELHDYMDRLRIETDNATGFNSEEDEEDDDLSESEKDDPSEKEIENESGSENENDVEATQKEKIKRPSRGAARKALADGDEAKLAQIVACDRARAVRKSEKHHGRKAQSGKTGRGHSGGKSKTGKSRLINDSLQF